MLVNTSFNVRGEPIVEGPEDVYRCFMCTEMDYLVLANYLLKKRRSARMGKGQFLDEFELECDSLPPSPPFPIHLTVFTILSTRIPAIPAGMTR